MTTTKKSAVFKVTGHGHDAEWRYKLLTVCSFFFLFEKSRPSRENFPCASNKEKDEAQLGINYLH